MPIIEDIQQAVECLGAALEAYPERRMDRAEEAVLRGEARPYPVCYIGRVTDIKAGEHLRPSARVSDVPEERLLGALRGMTAPLRMHNPIGRRVALGKGPGTLAASFGIFLDPDLGYTARGCRPLDALLADGLPDPETSGIIPEMRADIEAIQRLTPEWVQIALPDMQGPFNIAHMLLGEEAFFAPYEEPEKFARLMALITDFFLAVHARLRAWIDPARLSGFPADVARIAECSVNLISPDLYAEHVLPHDQRIATSYGQVAVHPCSGPHVFHATLNGLPNVVYQEAGIIEKTCAGSIGVTEALQAIGERPMILSIGEELPPGREEEVIRAHFDLARHNPRLLFNYTGMYWTRDDEPAMRELHRRLDAYWRERVWGAAATASG